MKQIGALVIVALFLMVMPGAMKFTAVVNAQPGINLSGYELLLGSNCMIDGQAGKCGVHFVGWTGGGGPIANGWTPFPGDRRGLWDAEINYIGSVNFGSAVELESGKFDVLFKTGQIITGNIDDGSTVTWPSMNSDLGCGKNVAKVIVTQNGNPLFTGCLHDLPAGTVIPPTIWGTLY
jgi:hypothetical protein